MIVWFGVGKRNVYVRLPDTAGNSKRIATIGSLLLSVSSKSAANNLTWCAVEEHDLAPHVEVISYH